MLTDQERARAYFRVGAAYDGRLIDDLATEFAAVRLDERRALVAWLRRVAVELPVISRLALRHQADRIERGEHADPRRSGTDSRV